MLKMKTPFQNKTNKNSRGNSAQFFVAGELCRRELVAVVTMGNTPNTDILCSNIEGTKFTHIQVKTFPPGNQKVTVGIKAEKNFGKNFIWVLAGIPRHGDDSEFVYYIIPSSEVSKNVKRGHHDYISKPGRKGQTRKDSNMRVIFIPPHKDALGWSIDQYKNRWDIIEDLLK